MRDIRPIRSDDDLTWALREIAPYFDAEPPLGSAESDRFGVLATLIESYENQRFPIAPPDPIDMLHHAGRSARPQPGRTRGFARLTLARPRSSIASAP